MSTPSSRHWRRVRQATAYRLVSPSSRGRSRWTAWFGCLAPSCGPLGLVDHVVGRGGRPRRSRAVRRRSGGPGRARSAPWAHRGRRGIGVGSPAVRTCPVAWALDLDGVIWLGDQPVPGSAEAVARLRAAGEPVAFVTNNSSEPVGFVEAKLARHGIPAEGAVVTSAMAAAAQVDPREVALVCAGPGVDEALAARGVRDGTRGQGRRGGGRLPPGLRLRPDGRGQRRGAGWRPSPGHQRRRHLPDPRGPDPRRRGHPGGREHRRGGRRRRGGQAAPTHGRPAPGPRGRRGCDGGGPARHRRPLRRRPRLPLRPRALGRDHGPARRAAARPRRRRPGRLVDAELAR